MSRRPCAAAVRSAKKYAEIVDSIEKVGLKQDIKVSSTRGVEGEAAYSLHLVL